jgi:hypothetical protein
MQRHSKFITLKDHQGTNPKQRYTTQKKKYIKIKIIKIVKMERVDGPLAPSEAFQNLVVTTQKKKLLHSNFIDKKSHQYYNLF